jgi:hypothetical protein
MDRLLTTEERNRFATYCEQYAHSCNLIVEQMSKLDPMMVKLLVPQERAKAAAYTIVARDLRSAEEMRIS